MQSLAVLVTDATIGQLVALHAKALLVLSVDSGPLHLAVSLATPTIQLFGPTDPRIFGPRGKKERRILLAYSLWKTGFLTTGPSRPSMCAFDNGAASLISD
jgi:ADP-heptose:LPS heptosyltransferase